MEATSKVLLVRMLLGPGSEVLVPDDKVILEFVNRYGDTIRAAAAIRRALDAPGPDGKEN